MPQAPLKPAAVLFLILPALLLASSAPASAQNEFNAAIIDTTVAQDRTLGMILMGTGVGTVGFMAGAMIGASTGDDGSEYAGLEEALLLGSITGGLALPLGVHVGNKNQGNLGAVTATSLAIGGLGWAIIFSSDNGAILPAIPLIQLIGCIAVESVTTPSKAGPQQQQATKTTKPPILVNLVPTRDGMGLFFSGSF